MKDERVIDCEEGFPTSIGQGRQSQGGSWRCTKGKKDILCFVEGKGGEGKYGKEINSYVGKCVVHEKKRKCKQEHGRKLCVAST